MFAGKDAPVCPVCGEGLDTHSHVVTECKHAEMVKCRRKWCDAVWKTMDKKMRGWRPRVEWGDARRLACAACVLREDGTVRDLLDEECMRATLGDWQGVSGDEVKQLRRGGSGEGSDAHVYEWMQMLNELVGVDGGGSTAEQVRKAKKASRVNISRQWRELVCTAWDVPGSQAVEMINAVGKVVLRGHHELWKVRCELMHAAGSKAGERAKMEEEVEQAVRLCERRWVDTDWLGEAVEGQGVAGLRGYVASLSSRSKRKWLKKVQRTKLAKSQPQIRDYGDFAPTALAEEIVADRQRRVDRRDASEVEERAPEKRQTTLREQVPGWAKSGHRAGSATGGSGAEGSTVGPDEGAGDEVRTGATTTLRQKDIREYGRRHKRRKTKLGHRDGGSAPRRDAQSSTQAASTNRTTRHGRGESKKAAEQIEREQARSEETKNRAARVERRSNGSGADGSSGGAETLDTSAMDRRARQQGESDGDTGQRSAPSPNTSQPTGTPMQQRLRELQRHTTAKPSRAGYGGRPAECRRRRRDKAEKRNSRRIRTTSAKKAREWVAKDSGEGQSDNRRGRKRIITELMDGTYVGGVVDYERQYEVDTEAD